MLSLNALNRLIKQNQKDRKSELLQEFLFFSSQFEDGVTKLAHQGKRDGQIYITTKGKMETGEIEELLANHYHPIFCYVTNNETHNNQKARKKSHFIVEVVIPEVRIDNSYGYSIIEGA